MADRNITREIADRLGLGLRPRSEWSDAQKIKFDSLVFGTGVGRMRPDGTLEHIPFEELVFERFR